MEAHHPDRGAGADLVRHQRRTADDRAEAAAGREEALFGRRAPVVVQADAADEDQIRTDDT